MEGLKKYQGRLGCRSPPQTVRLLVSEAVDERLREKGEKKERGLGGSRMPLPA